MRKIIVTLLLSAFLFTGCESVLEETPFSELGTESLNTTEGAYAILYSAYSSASLLPVGNGGVSYLFLSSMSSGETWNVGGNIEAQQRTLTDFTWDSNHGFLGQAWSVPYAAIRDANLLLAEIPNTTLADDIKSGIIAEATFIRGFSYTLLYNWFGPVPLVTPETASDYYLPKATEEEIRAFIENDLRTAADGLPVTRPDYGRATKGAALGILTKFLLNTKQWSKTEEVAREIIALERYALLPEYADVFDLEKEGNDELLWVLTRHAISGPQFINALTFPTDYPLPPNQGVYAARTYTYDEFIDSFIATDRRADLFVREYTNTSGQHVQLYGKDQSLSLKYPFDPEASGQGMGNDIPVVRYADILLSLAEALNEQNGPEQESIDLINEVWQRANEGIATPLTPGAFTKESLRERIHQEREWEFYSEGKRREDQIRAGTFISKAIARGKKASSHHVLFPIPQTEISSNPNLKQNDGY